ncbi:hypothetical protein Moror_4844 [Moniliophthora roreri MCA 2997]|uniref:Uncharacterized protein n=2 Tax=Moniliophthora roreri TaxID=221103 RepID=V2XVV5_MONRO|nr:hypothetical protein Moror_4844 [Moniliophthora roreri MCA 2997]
MWKAIIRSIFLSFIRLITSKKEWDIDQDFLREAHELNILKQNTVFNYTSHASYMGGAEANDDLEAEHYTMGPPTSDNSGGSDNNNDDSTNDSIEKSTVDPAADFAAVLTSASTGVTEGTVATYQSLMWQCTKFQQDHGFIKPNKEFFTSAPCKNAPELIISPQSDNCDSIKLDGTIWPKDKLHATYSHAQKQHASVTYRFGQDVWQSICLPAGFSLYGQSEALQGSSS